MANVLGQFTAPDWITALPDAGAEYMQGEENGTDIINRVSKTHWDYVQTLESAMYYNANVKYPYGANTTGAVGDGVAYEDDFFSAAISNTAGTIIVPDGTYLFDNPLVISRAKTRLVLSPNATLKTTGGSQDVIQITADDVEIIGGTIDATGQSGGVHYGIKITGDRCKIESMFIKNTTQYAIYGSEIGELRITNNRFEANGQASNHYTIFIQNETTTTKTKYNISYNEIETSYAGIKIVDPNSFDADAPRARIIGNDIVSATGWAIEVYGVGDYSVASNNTISVSGGNGGISMAATDYSIIEGNSVKSSSTNGTGIEIASSGYCSVGDNVISGFNVGIGVFGNTFPTHHCTVGNNNISNTNSYGIHLNAVNESSPEYSTPGPGTTYIVMTGNKITRKSGGTSTLIYCAFSTYCSIAGGVLHGNGASGSEKAITLDKSGYFTITGVHANEHLGGFVLITANSAYTAHRITINSNTLVGAGVPFTSSGSVTLGTAIVAMNNPGPSGGDINYLDGAAGIYEWLAQNNDPEGVKTANIGSRYWRKNGSAGTILYTKESGSGNTGWAATNQYLKATEFQDTTPSNFTYNGIKAQIGQVGVAMVGGASSYTQAVTFPSSFATLLGVWIEIKTITGINLRGKAWVVKPGSAGISGFTIEFISDDSSNFGSAGQDVTFFWRAEGL